jgi:hypothetical protein
MGGDEKDEFVENLRKERKKSCRQGSGEKNNNGRRQKKNVTPFGLAIT